MEYQLHQEQFRLQNFMDTCHRQAMLYAFFLEISKNVVYDIVHQRQQVPVNGEDMYLYLQDRFKNYFGGGYKEKINNCEFLLDYQRKQLLPKDGEKNLQELDFTMYMNILKLLGVNANTGIIKYMKELRNRLCHVSFISLQQGISQQKFRKHLDMMEFHFIRLGVDITLVNTCKNDILYRI